MQEQQQCGLWLPVLWQLVTCVCWCLWASTSTACISTPNMVRHDICRHNYAVERRQVVGFCGQPHYCYQPYYPAARFRSSISLVKHGLWWTVSGEVKAHVVLTCTNGVSPNPNHLLVIVASDSRHVRIDRIWRWTKSTPGRGWWRSHMTGIYSDCSTREITMAV